MNESRIHIAIAILNYNGRNHLERFLPSIAANTYPNFSLWVIDNASADDSPGFLKTNYPEIKTIILRENHGFAGGYNEGIRMIPHEYILLLNSDIAVDPGFLLPLIAAMEKDEKLASCQPKILSLNKPDYFEFAGAAGGMIDALGYPFCRGRIFDYCEKDIGQYNDQCEIFWSSGAAMLIRKSLFEKLGGFYPYFFMHSEEIDYCWRAQKAGYSIGYCGMSTVYHLGAASLKKENPYKTLLNFRNNLVMLSRNHAVRKLFWLLPMRVILDMVAALQMVTHKQYENGQAVLKAWGQFLRWMMAADQGKWPASETKKTALAGFYKGSIVWQHFIAKKQTWKEISGDG